MKIQINLVSGQKLDGWNVWAQIRFYSSQEINFFLRCEEQNVGFCQDHDGVREFISKQPRLKPFYSFIPTLLDKLDDHQYLN